MSAISDRGATPVFVVIERNMTQVQDDTPVNIDDPRYRWFLSQDLANEAHGELISGRELTKRNQGHTRQELIEFIAAIH